MRIGRSLLLALLLIACDEDPTAPAPDSVVMKGLRFEAELEAAGPNTNLLVSVFNDAESPVTADFAGPCMLRARLYRPGTSTLAWDGIQAFPLCPTDVFHLTIPARSSLRGQWVVGMSSAMLGDSLPPGEYSVVAALRPQGRDGEVKEIFAGTARF